MTNILIGIGGSGARCVEAFLHLAAAGIGPSDVSVCIIDQDAANGNSANAVSLLSQLMSLQGALKRAGGHRIPDETPFLRTSISPLNDSGYWTPELPANSRKPDSYFRADSMRPATRALYDALYSRDEQQGIDLEQGYHGRPNIGAAVLTASVLANDKFLRSLVDKIVSSSGAGRETRIFLVGSIFGGTGAAGFPTIARLISRHPDVARQRNAIKIGGALLLPYFHFSDTAEAESVVRAQAASFLRNTEGALRYYDMVEKEGGIYDALYVVGLNPYLTRPNLGPGGKIQVNPPMLPELLGALAAARHFLLNVVDPESVHISGRAKKEEFGWEDLPPPTATDQTSLSTARAKLRNDLGAAVRFAFSYSNVYRPALTPFGIPSIKKEAWFRRHLSTCGDAIRNETQAELSALDTYLKRFLEWTASMTLASEVRNVFSLRLFEVGRFAETVNDKGEVRLKDRPKRQEFPHLVSGGEARGLQAVMDELTYANTAHGGDGLGQFIAALYRACRLS